MDFGEEEFSGYTFTQEHVFEESSRLKINLFEILSRRKDFEMACVTGFYPTSWT